MSAPVQSRRRGERLRRAIFEAVFDQLGKVGYARLSMEGVAAAAETGKAALYRRWDSKDELVRDALQELLPEPPQIAESTGLRAGLIELLSYFNSTLFDSKGTAFQAVAAESGTDVAILREVFRSRVTLPCQERITELLHRHLAASGSTMSPQFDAETFAAVGPAMLTYHCINGHDKSTLGEIESIIDKTLLPLIRDGATQPNNDEGSIED
ncbi:AcrR family transcriptional regulator [Naumannella cuiyingiana]|uniref:AcrR family transcriptional regulator n=1 Tax=Naumannella cuiyingiana TaxID=1347891 RepID=A0A7Z0D8N8_9ACTN|nr:TetR family transcriptional regulator [Naumannella cuiyingiana]NYI71009.1 AcrR family transcriptional regulator [Naumannella cuiyingiana]